VGAKTLRVLAFDTATRATSVALAISEHEPPLQARDDPPAGERPRHTTRLLPLLAEVLEQAQMSFGQVDRIAVGVGPGTFTGLRIGIATARGLAQAGSIPLVGVPTLHSMALGAETFLADARDIDTVAAVIDARRGEVFVAAWSARQLYGAPALAAGVVNPDLLKTLLPSHGMDAGNALAIGDGAVAFRSVFERSGALVPGDDSELHQVSAANHCRLALSLSPREPDAIHPLYLRPPDAKPASQSLAFAP
jgi:tRNA threonylcarbamoyladenosine biosynthesis protein TsaB